jgi:hypothetical protein
MDKNGLKQLLKDKSLLAIEIAKLMNEKPQNVRFHMKKMGYSAAKRFKASDKAGRQNIKHKHLRPKVMKYFLTHSMEETGKHFGLTRSELKSIFTVAYKQLEFKHLRKDKRTKKPWTFKNSMFTLRYGGLQNRIWIAKKMGRGKSHHVIKERIKALNTKTRYVNGLPLRYARELVGEKAYGFKVKAGPTGPGVDCRPIIVPWVLLYKLARKNKNVPEHFLLALKAMARFQKMIHGTKSFDQTIESIQTCIGGKCGKFS